METSLGGQALPPLSWAKFPVVVDKDRHFCVERQTFPFFSFEKASRMGKFGGTCPRKPYPSASEAMFDNVR